MKKITMKLALLLFVIIALWAKSSYIQSNAFELPIENGVQEFILKISPLSSILLMVGVAILFGNVGLFLGYSLLTTILYANLLYFREMNDYITIPVLMQTSNAGTLSATLADVLQWGDLVYWFDLPILLVMLIIVKRKNLVVWKKRQSVAMIYGAVFVFLANMGLAETERTDILTRSFDRQILIKSIGIYNYLVYDAVVQTKTSAQRAMADETELKKIQDYVSSKHVAVNAEYSGVAKGRNLYVVALESTQTFVIDNKLNGEEITPFLNDLKEDSIYFNNFFHQVGQGKTSDSEFLLENSLYPLDRGSVFFTHATNTYHALPNILKETGYYSSVMHSNDASFWNRDAMYKSLGYDKFNDVNSFEVSEENSVGWGLKDKEMFTQSIELIKSMPQPHYVKFLTLTNHFPFTLDEEDATIEAGNFKSNTLNRYFQTVRYEDEAVELFFKELKDAGLYENSIILLYGDHFGISDNHTSSMEDYLGYDIGDLEQFELQKVPMYIVIPGVTDQESMDENQKINSKVSGQIDIRPTILNLLGVEDTSAVSFGEDLLSPTRESFVAMRDGSAANSDYAYVNTVCYDRHTSEKVDDQYCDELVAKSETELTNSNELIYGDLLRFSGLKYEKTDPTETSLKVENSSESQER